MKTIHYLISNLLSVQCVVLALAMIFAQAGRAFGQLDITDNFTQNGGTLNVSNAPNVLSVGSASNPLLTLTSGAQANGVWRLDVGTQLGQSGQMLLEQNSTMVLDPDGDFFGSRIYLGGDSGGNGILTIRTGASVDMIGSIVVGSGGSGVFRVEQGGYFNAYQMVVGRSGTVAGTGAALVTGQNSRVDLEGPFDTSLSVGIGDPGGAATLGTLIISDGGVVTSNAATSIGNLAPGQMSIFDPGSTLVTNGLVVGQSIGGHGAITISGGGTMISQGAMIGYRSSAEAPGPQGNVTVTGAGSLWSNNGSLILGNEDFFGPVNYASSGNLIVTGGAQVLNNGVVTLGRTNGTSSTVSVSGGAKLTAASTEAHHSWGMIVAAGADSIGQLAVSGFNSHVDISGEIVVGSLGTATLEVTHGGRLSAGHASLGYYQASQASAVVSGEGSRWVSSGNFYLGGNETQINNHLHGGPSTLTVRDGGVVESQGPIGLTVFDTSTLTGSGGTIIANTVSNRGLVSPGDNGAGTMTIGGSYNQADIGTLLVELGGVIAGVEYDQLNITNLAFLDGFLQVELVDGFQLGYNQTFDILNSGNLLSGIFHGLPDGALVGNYDGIDLFIRYAEIPGPAGNGGLVRLYTPVPEPSSLLVVGFAGLAMSLCRRRRCLE